ncbi:MAG TPA: hypothetical protein VKM55_23330 [Candidatus Lokiarchaeia archaeon]|nr:hypothetical protein [Candidatus Lokiarchaeia archaeon]
MTCPLLPASSISWFSRVISGQAIARAISVNLRNIRLEQLFQ